MTDQESAFVGIGYSITTLSTQEWRTGIWPCDVFGLRQSWACADIVLFLRDQDLEVLGLLSFSTLKQFSRNVEWASSQVN